MIHYLFVSFSFNQQSFFLFRIHYQLLHPQRKLHEYLYIHQTSQVTKFQCNKSTGKYPVFTYYSVELECPTVIHDSLSVCSTSTVFYFTYLFSYYNHCSHRIRFLRNKSATKYPIFTYYAVLLECFTDTRYSLFIYFIFIEAIQ